ncbi:hypothetical protein BDQ17DRAFT_1323034 [Cyathus striatus]|nr:hypothetical protein BDQ17DRAFT_1323034 [Cyathus striatus]
MSELGAGLGGETRRDGGRKGNDSYTPTDFSTPQHPPLQVSQTTPNPSPPSSSSSVSSHSSAATPRQNRIDHPSRRIRFAPLPDPRRAVLITDDGDELPLPEAEDATQFPGPSTPTPANAPNSLPTTPSAEAAVFQDYAQDTESIGSSSSSSRNSKRNSYSTDPSSVPSTPGTATPLSLNTAEQDYLSSVPASPSTYLPLHSSRITSAAPPSSSSGSTHTLTPVASLEGRPSEKHSKGGITKEEILTLGTINLFRASSRDAKYVSGHESDPGFSSSLSNLARWTSASSTGARSNASNNFGAPLARTQSTQSYTSRPSTAPGFVAPSPNRSKGVPNHNPRMRGARMLNGRVYGGPKKNPNAKNPFANVRDEEPEFVEWGYGGMGSVKGAKSAGVTGSRWERLQGQGAVAKGAEADAEDDGSGMGWVKKRKMERERKEREERETKEHEEERKNSEEVKEQKVEEKPVVEPTEAPEHPSLPTIASLRGASSQSQRPSTPSSTHTAEEEHVLRAVTIPARPHYHHHRTHSRSSSKDISVYGSNLSLEEEKASVTLEDVKEHEEVERRSESSESDERRKDTRVKRRKMTMMMMKKRRGRKEKDSAWCGSEKISRHKEVHDEPSAVPATTEI